MPEEGERGGHAGVGDVVDAEAAQGIPVGPGLHLEQRLHQRLGDGAAGRDDHDAVAEPAGADQDELAGADERPREALALAFEGRGAELDHRQDDHQGEREPEGEGVDVLAGSVGAQVGGQEQLAEREHDAQHEQAGVPDREHGRGPGVGRRLGDDVAELLERVGDVAEAGDAAAEEVPDVREPGDPGQPRDARESDPREPAVADRVEQTATQPVREQVAGWRRRGTSLDRRRP